MKLKITKIKDIHSALLKLDGYDKVVEVDGKEKIIKAAYDFTGKVRWNLSKNASILQRKLEGFDKVRNDLVDQISEGKGVIKPDETEKMQKFEKELLSVLTLEEEIDGILAISFDDFNLSKNQIPVSVLSALEPIVKVE